MVARIIIIATQIPDLQTNTTTTEGCISHWQNVKQKVLPGRKYNNSPHLHLGPLHTDTSPCPSPRHSDYHLKIQLEGYISMADVFLLFLYKYNSRSQSVDSTNCRYE